MGRRGASRLDLQVSILSAQPRAGAPWPCAGGHQLAPSSPGGRAALARLPPAVGESYLNKANANGLKGLKEVILFWFLFWCCFLGDKEDVAAWSRLLQCTQTSPRYKGPGEKSNSSN